MSDRTWPSGGRAVDTVDTASRAQRSDDVCFDGQPAVRDGRSWVDPQLIRWATSGRLVRVVGPNPALDRLELVDEFHVNAVNRSEEVVRRAGGKGAIVARGICRLGGSVAIYGFLGGHVGEFVREELRELGIVDRHVAISDETRITSVIVERRSGRSTVVNEPGPVIQPEEQAELLDRLEAECQPGDLVVTNGSLPRGVPDSYHGDIVDVVRRSGGIALLDSSGRALATAIRRGPWLVKPNLAEFCALVERRLDVAHPDEIVREMRRVVREWGVSHLIVTFGAAGAVYTDGDTVVHALPPAVRIQNATGSGDLLVAGLVFALADGASMTDALRFGTAAAAAGAGRIEPDLDGRAEVDALAGRVVLREVETPSQLQLSEP